MQVTIAEPVLVNPLEQFKPHVADNTRRALLDLFPPKELDVEVTAVHKEVMAEIKLQVYAQCDNAMGRAVKAADALGTHTEPRAMMSVAMMVAGEAAYMDNHSDLYNPRAHSYRLEYANQWLKAYLFTHKMEMPTEHQAIALGTAEVPRSTNGYMDHQINDWARCLGITVFSQGLIRQLPEVNIALQRLLDRKYHVQWDKYERFSTTVCAHATELEGMVSFRKYLLGVTYTEDGVAWFAGYLTLDDFFKLRYRRMRLGAAIKEITKSDELARIAADIRELTDYSIVLHPNDRPFGAEYRRLYLESGDMLGSCMTRDAEGYSSPLGVHPCDVYSTAHYGQGDNGLVLVEVRTGSGETSVPVGRGILNIDNGTIVRWYGQHKASVMLRNVYGIQFDSEALDGVNIAVIRDGDRVAAPYLDGIYRVEWDDGTLTIGNRGDIEMDDTPGYQTLEDDTEYDTCRLSGNEYPVDDMVWQDSTCTYHHPDYVDEDYVFLCPVLGEYAPDTDGSYLMVDGIEMLVHNDVDEGCYSRRGWVSLPGIGLTQDAGLYTYDEVTERYYDNGAYEDLINEREEEQDAE